MYQLAHCKAAGRLATSRPYELQCRTRQNGFPMDQRPDQVHQPSAFQWNVKAFQKKPD
jgi:hypothetical protein